MKKNVVLLVCIVVGFCLGGMANGAEKSHLSERGENGMQDVSIFFGHQSVGLNILNGIRDTDFLENHQDFKILETKNANEVNGPGLYHRRVGKNRDPRTKIDEFATILRAGMADKVDIAALKLCYVDFNSSTDVGELFQYYQQTVEELEKEFPGLQIVHFSAPLKTVKISWKTKVKQWLGKDDIWEFAENIKRNEYNKLLRSEFQDEDKIFDIAALEATHKNGQKESFKVGGKQYYALADQYSHDGGHLNDEGRRWVAEHFIKYMKRLN